MKKNDKVGDELMGVILVTKKNMTRPYSEDCEYMPIKWQKFVTCHLFIQRTSTSL